MKFFNKATLLATLLTAANASLRGAQQATTSRELTTNVTTDFIQISGLNLETDNCIDFEPLCTSFLDIISAGTLNDNANNTNATLYAEAAAQVLCSGAKQTSASSYSIFQANLAFSVKDTDGEVEAIELHSTITYASQAMSFAQSNALSLSEASSQAYAYLSQNELCDTLRDTVPADQLPLWDYVCAPQDASSASYSLAVAEAEGSSVARAFARGASGTSVRVEGDDIHLFKASIVSGVSSFASANSHALATAYSEAFSRALTVRESFDEICQEWYSGYCMAASNSVLALAFCDGGSEEVCDYVYDLILAGGEVLAETYGEAAVLGAASSEVTLGFDVCFAKDESNSTMTIDLLGAAVSDVGIISTCM